MQGSHYKHTLRLYGCVFHFKTNVSDNVNKNLRALRNTCPEFKKLVQMILALVWVPSAELTAYWMAIKAFCVGRLHLVPGHPTHKCYPRWQEKVEAIHTFLRYVTNTWVGDEGGNREPTYKPEQWSGCRTLLDESIPSTQGGNEAYNQHFRM